MNQPGPSDPSFGPDDEPGDEPAPELLHEPIGHELTARDFFGPTWIDRVRPWLVLAIPLVPIAAALLAGLPFGRWRTLQDVLVSTDPATLVPGMRLDLEPWITVIPRWLDTAVIAAAIGVLTWFWRGGTRGFGFFAGLAAFSLSLLIEGARWFKPGELPDFRDPLIAAAVAFAVWRLLRLSREQPVTPLPRYGPCRTRRRILIRFLFGWVLLGLAAVAASVAPVINLYGYPPTQAAAHIATLREGHIGLAGVLATSAEQTSELVGLTRWLWTANELAHRDDLPYPSWAGAGAAHDGVLPGGQLRSVTTVEALRQAVGAAMPGDVILLQPGTYPLRGNYLAFTRPGTAAAPIIVRAPRLGLAILESELSEGLKVQAPHWRFENLVLRGVCTDDSACDNGFHITGAAEDTVLHNLRVEDFNAQIKINGENGQFPDGGRIEFTTLIDTHTRKTANPVTPIDLVGADGWVIQDNLIADFVKASGNATSYGAFAKGASHGTVFTRDVVLCEWHLRGVEGETVGLSFGGGGTEWALRRDGGHTGYEHSDGVMAENLIAFCSDDGIYLNRAANSAVRHNTLLATAGIEVRFAESTARLDGNLVDGSIRAHDDGMFWGDGNQAGTLTSMFLGRNPVRALFVDPARLDLRWRALPELVRPDTGVDLCGAEWTQPAPAGAFQDFRKCDLSVQPATGK